MNTIPYNGFANSPPRKYYHNGDLGASGGRLTADSHKAKNFPSPPPTSVTANQKRDIGASFLHKDMYAGAKFSEHPHPTQLPKPPSHWVVKSCGASTPKNNTSRKPRRYTEAQ